MKNAFKKAFIALSTAALLATSSLPAFASWFGTGAKEAFEKMIYVDYNYTPETSNLASQELKTNCINSGYEYIIYDSNYPGKNIECTFQKDGEVKTFKRGEAISFWINTLAEIGLIKLNFKKTEFDTNKRGASYDLLFDVMNNKYGDLKILSVSDEAMNSPMVSDAGYDVLVDREFSCGAESCVYLKVRDRFVFTDFGKKVCDKFSEVTMKYNKKNNSNVDYLTYAYSCIGYGYDSYDEVIFKNEGGILKKIDWLTSATDSFTLANKWNVNTN